MSIRAHTSASWSQSRLSAQGPQLPLRVKTRSALIEHTVSGFAPKADVPMRALAALRLGSATSFKPPKTEARIMRYELSDDEWTTIGPMLPNKARGCRG
jgi:hypothetical protein